MRLLHWLTAGLLALTLAACGEGDLVGNRVKDDVGDLNALATAGPTVEEVLSRGDDAVKDEPPPVPFDHIGRWAASRDSCAGEAWIFTPAGVNVGDERCLVTGSDTVSGTSKKLALRCTKDEIETIESWALNLHPDARMTISRSEGGNGVPRSTTLARCG